MAESARATSVLDGLAVLDLGGTDAVHLGARLLSDLGAEVVRVAVEDEARVPERQRLRDDVWGMGTHRVILAPGEQVPAELLAAADVVLTTPFEAGLPAPRREQSPDAVWVSVTPFGLTGPRATWRAGDLGVMASSGNLYISGYDDRAPVRCSQPLADAHVGPEVAIAVLFALNAGGRREVDVSAVESIAMANMGLGDRARTLGQPLTRDGGRGGVGTSQVWRCRDGFVGLGLGGGIARQPTMDRVFQLMAEDGIEVADLRDGPWSSTRWKSMSPTEQDEVTARFDAFFAGRGAAELQAIAYKENLMMAAVLTGAEVLASEQLAAREFFVDFENTGAPVPGPFVALNTSAGRGLRVPTARATTVSAAEAVALFDARPARQGPGDTTGGGAWEGLSMVEFMTSGAGPLIGRYFAENGADVIRVESRGRPDFLRMVAPHEDHGLDASPLFDSINAGKRSIAVDLARPEGLAVARRLALAADVVTENFAPRTMRKFGLDHASLAVERPDVIYLSSCLSGHTGPYKDFPGFGGQGSALSGYTWLTGWPDRVPLGPAQAVTDSISPRFGAAVVAALLQHRARTGEGARVDLSQVETAAWTLAPWLLAESLVGPDTERWGNRDPDRAAVPHGAFRCSGLDRWIAIAVRDDVQWARLAEVLGDTPRRWSTPAGRLADIDAVEAAVTAWTSRQDPVQAAGILQFHGIEAVPVANGIDTVCDPQLHHRGHFQVTTHPRLGERFYERTGFRFDALRQGYERPSPLLGQHSRDVLGEYLGMGESEYRDLAERGIVG
ncbi:CoA transferase [Nocardia sp. NPDC050799]|uniref:CaiB/BaiF CoA-transferase family protein n=1 Tax=Nocardia sp. NPDC050799 TaxID=3154842 RepID=UPI0033D95EE0